MCTTVDTHHMQSIERLAIRFGIRDINLPPGKYVNKISDSIPIMYSDGQPKARGAQFGLTPKYWKKGVRPKLLFNAKSETLDKLPNFRYLYGKQHCVIMVNGFYENMKTTPRRPFYFDYRSNLPVAMAGLWKMEGEKLETTIITTSPNSLMAPIHNRMPVILDNSGIKEWLAHSKNPHLFEPSHSEKLQTYEVCSYVNSREADGERCLQPPKSYITLPLTLKG